MFVLKTKYQKLSQVAFSPDGRGLAAAGRWGAYYWRSVFDDPKPKQFGTNECGGVGFTPDGAHLLATIAHNNMFVIGLNTESEHVVDLVLSYRALAVCPATGLAVVERWTGGEMSGWRVDPDGLAVRVWAVNVQPGSIGGQVAFSPDGAWFIRAARAAGERTAYRLVVHDPNTGHEIGSHHGSAWVSCGPAVSPDNEWIAFGNASALNVRSLNDPKYRKSDANDNTHQYTGLAFHPSGRFLAVTNNDQTVKLYDTATWEIARRFTWEIGRMRSVAFSPDGTLAAAGSDKGKVVIWDVDV